MIDIFPLGGNTFDSKVPWPEYSSAPATLFAMDLMGCVVVILLLEDKQ